VGGPGGLDQWGVLPAAGDERRAAPLEPDDWCLGVCRGYPDGGLDGRRDAGSMSDFYDDREEIESLEYEIEQD
jgi:hypothetical protein